MHSVGVEEYNYHSVCHWYDCCSVVITVWKCYSVKLCCVGILSFCCCYLLMFCDNLLFCSVIIDAVITCHWCWKWWLLLLMTLFLLFYLLYSLFDVLPSDVLSTDDVIGKWLYIPFLLIWERSTVEVCWKFRYTIVVACCLLFHSVLVILFIVIWYCYYDNSNLLNSFVPCLVVFIEGCVCYSCSDYHLLLIFILFWWRGNVDDYVVYWLLLEVMKLLHWRNDDAISDVLIYWYDVVLWPYCCSVNYCSILMTCLLFLWYHSMEVFHCSVIIEYCCWKVLLYHCYCWYPITVLLLIWWWWLLFILLIF